MGQKYMLVLKPNKKNLRDIQPFALECNDGIISYEDLRFPINSNIEPVTYLDLGDEDIVAYVDEEGLLKRLTPTVWIKDSISNEISSIPLVGNVVIVKHVMTEDGIEAAGLEDEEVKDVLRCVKLVDGIPCFQLKKGLTLGGEQ